jgi:hypothetical protein
MDVSRSRLLLALAVAVPLTLAACAPAAVDHAPQSICDLKQHPVYIVGGEVHGLRGIGLKLQNGHGEEVRIGSDGTFIFNSPVDDGSDYAVTIAREPISPVQSCTLDHGHGRINGRDAMEIAVTCTGIGMLAAQGATYERY